MDPSICLKLKVCLFAFLGRLLENLHIDYADGKRDDIWRRLFYKARFITPLNEYYLFNRKMGTQQLKNQITSSEFKQYMS